VNGIHVALMGDPTLRLHPVLPPSRLRARPGSTVELRWRPSPDPKVTGYHVYRAQAQAGPFVRLTAAPVAEARYTDRGRRGSTRPVYMVRAVRWQRGPSGVYLNASQGTFAAG